MSVLQKPGGPNSGDVADEAEEDLNFAEDAEDVLYGYPDNLQVCAFCHSRVKVLCMTALLVSFTNKNGFPMKSPEPLSAYSGYCHIYRSWNESNGKLSSKAHLQNSIHDLHFLTINTCFG